MTDKLRENCLVIQQKFPYLNLNCDADTKTLQEYYFRFTGYKEYDEYNNEYGNYDEYKEFHPEYLGEYIDIEKYRINFIDINHMELLYKRDEWDNQIYRYQDKYVKILKILDNNHEDYYLNYDKYVEMRREIIISKFLHKHFPHNIINIQGFFEFDDINDNHYFAIVSSEINGQPFNIWLETTDLQTLKLYILRLFRFLVLLNRKYKFTHYDLHTGNFLVGMNIDGVYPILIDFGRTYIEFDLKWAEKNKISPILGGYNEDINVWHHTFLIYDFVLALLKIYNKTNISPKLLKKYGDIRSQNIIDIHNYVKKLLKFVEIDTTNFSITDLGFDSFDPNIIISYIEDSL